jgi:hypothetical protein
MKKPYTHPILFLSNLNRKVLLFARIISFMKIYVLVPAVAAPGQI